jgi:hypothetical protein
MLPEEKDKCLLCDEILTEEGTSPYSLCYDPSYKTNCWGGDSHDYIGFFCRKCGKKLARNK